MQTQTLCVSWFSFLHMMSRLCVNTSLSLPASLLVSGQTGECRGIPHVTAPPLFYSPSASGTELPLAPCLHRYLSAQSLHFLCFLPSVSQALLHENNANILSLFICLELNFDFLIRIFLVALETTVCIQLHSSSQCCFVNHVPNLLTGE